MLVGPPAKHVKVCFKILNCELKLSPPGAALFVNLFRSVLFFELRVFLTLIS